MSDTLTSRQQEILQLIRDTVEQEGRPPPGPRSAPPLVSAPPTRRKPTSAPWPPRAPSPLKRAVPGASA